MEQGERRTSPVELLWDLVFVFAVTQVTTLLSRDLSWAGLGRGMLVLALVWWAWAAFVWAANAQDTGSPTLRLALLLAMVLVFVAGLALEMPREKEKRAAVLQKVADYEKAFGIGKGTPMKDEGQRYLSLDIPDVR